MTALSGVTVIGDYAGAADDHAAVQVLIDLLPNPDATHGTGAVADAANFGANNTYLDEMSPAAAAQLRAELLALQDAVDTTNTLE